MTALEGWRSESTCSVIRVLTKAAFSLGLLLMTAPVWAVQVISVPLHSQDIEGTVELGTTTVAGIGEVRFVARREGTRLVVHALAPGGLVIGKADTVTGLQETPIYLKTEEGLQPFSILWGQPPRHQ